MTGRELFTAINAERPQQTVKIKHRAIKLTVIDFNIALYYLLMCKSSVSYKYLQTNLTFAKVLKIFATVGNNMQINASFGKGQGGRTLKRLPCI